MANAGGRVQFDFDGALRLARKLWALADEIDVRRRSRRSNANSARAKWEGPLVSEFDALDESEWANAEKIAQQLRDEARLWGEAWAGAMNQQNKNNRMAEVERVRDERGRLEKLNDTVNPFASDDSDDQVPMPPYPAVPGPAGFAPTATEIRY